MPVSKKQKTLACIAYSMSKGETPKSYSAAAAKMLESMGAEKCKEWCEGPIEKT